MKWSGGNAGLGTVWSYSEFFKENLHLFDALDFLAELTQHIPPARFQLIRRYGLYSSRIKGRWSRMPYVAARAPEGWQRTQAALEVESADDRTSPSQPDHPDASARRQAWARLLARVYEVDPLVCPRCGDEMKVIAVIQDPEQIRKILAYLKRTGRSPPGMESAATA